MPLLAALTLGATAAISGTSLRTGALPVDSGGVQTLPLHCLGGYMWYTEVHLGTPSRLYNMTIDTGSSDFIVSGAGCDCGIDPDTMYNASASATSERITCDDTHFQCGACIDESCANSVDYGGSINESFVLVRDHVSVAAGSLSATTVFGDVFDINMTDSLSSHRKLSQQRRRNGNHNQRRLPAKGGVADDMFYPEGMWGLGFPALVSAGYPPLFDALVGASSNGLEDMFSVEISPSGGNLTLGGTKRESSEFQNVPLIAPRAFYAVKMLDFLVDGTSVGVNSSVYNVYGEGCIVDTGTSVPSLPAPAFDSMSAQLHTMCSHGVNLHGICDAAENETLLEGHCFNFTDTELAAFPDFQYKFDGGNNGTIVELVYAASAYLAPQYFCEYPEEKGLAMTPDTTFTVLGASFLQQFEVSFDRRQQDGSLGYVGFAKL